jgi:hypothetical protein
MSQAKQQIDLELEEVDQGAEADESDVDDEQESLFDGVDTESPEEQSTNDNTGSTASSSNTSDSDSRGLTQFGVEEDPSPNKPRLDNPDGELEQDRRTNTRMSSDETEQEALFPDIENEDQVTLTGEKAYNQCLFGQD